MRAHSVHKQDTCLKKRWPPSPPTAAPALQGTFRNMLSDTRRLNMLRQTPTRPIKFQRGE